MSDAEIHCVRRGASGHILLDRPAALNAVTLGMVRAIAGALDEWEHDPAIRCVVVEAAGERAFSAGGDIRLLYEQGRAGDHDAQLRFWREEYILNRRVRTYPKPYVALIDGIVMGGGVGVSLHGSHRIAGDRFVFAMPEVGIGFFPDVGATYFLPRLPGRIGTYFALTGARAKTGDAVALELADAYVPSSQFRALADMLAADGDVEAALTQFRAPPPSSTLAADRTLIDECFAASSVRDILARLDAAGTDRAREIGATLRTKSPTSLAIAFRQMQIGATFDMDEAMRTEFRIVSRVCRDHDFLEGVRATIIDKDMNPRWRPASLEGIDPARVDAMFAPLGRDELSFAAREYAG
jgi:enoyl-CoA hydratase